MLLMIMKMTTSTALTIKHSNQLIILNGIHLQTQGTSNIHNSKI